MNCRDCSNFNVKRLAQKNMKLAKAGYGYCDANEGWIPIAGLFCDLWEPSAPESVQARENFWSSR